MFRRPLGGGEAQRQLADGAVYHIYRFEPDGTHHLVARHDFDWMPLEILIHGDHVYWNDQVRVQRARKR